MITRNYILAVIVAFAVIVGLDYLVHSLMLADLYERTAVLWRSPDTTQLWVMFLSQFLFSCVFVFIFTCNYENRGLAEGLRFGLYIGLLMASFDLGSYCYLPVPFVLTACWMLSSVVKCLCAGLVTAGIYRTR